MPEEFVKLQLNVSCALNGHILFLSNAILQMVVLGCVFVNYNDSIFYSQNIPKACKMKCWNLRHDANLKTE